MAYEIGQKRVQDTEDYNDFALGLKLPIKSGNNGLFEQNFSTIEQAKSNIKNLLMTQYGERVMQPNFGSNLNSVLFEQMDDIEFEDKVVSTIESAVERWLPYVTIGDIELDLSNSNIDRNLVEVTISFTVGNDIDTNTVTFTLEE